MACVLLDRDGTIIFDKHYLHDPWGVELLPGAAQGLLCLAQQGHTLGVVTNQSGVGRGYFTIDDVHACNARLTELLTSENISLTDYFICPHAPEENCDCRKPGPGLARQAAMKLGIDLKSTFVIGDKPADVNLGKAVGAKSILVLTGKGKESVDKCKPDFIAQDLAEAADWIEQQQES